MAIPKNVKSFNVHLSVIIIVSISDFTLPVINPLSIRMVVEAVHRVIIVSLGGSLLLRAPLVKVAGSGNEGGEKNCQGNCKGCNEFTLKSIIVRLIFQITHRSLTSLEVHPQ